MSSVTVLSSGPQARNGTTSGSALDVSSYARVRLLASGSVSGEHPGRPVVAIMGRPLVGPDRLLGALRLGEHQFFELGGITSIYAQWSVYSDAPVLAPFTLGITGEAFS